MSWASDYIGIPFVDHGRTFDGCDCWGLVRLVYHLERGIELPSYLDVYESIKDGGGLSGNWSAVRHQWQPAKKPVEFVIPLFFFHNGCLHVGVMVDDHRMLHVEKGKDACIESVEKYSSWLHDYYLPK